MIRRRIYYRGNVQGVGFRFTAERIAQNFAVDGYVSNMSDGSVEMVVEGEGMEVDAFMDDLAEQMQGKIRGVDVQEEVYQREFDGFEIRF
ncbi:MAG: acylphosphatase [Planctomycetes bacterium]|nr:acylphosphatase [Planctomycetota bacterium]